MNVIQWVQNIESEFDRSGIHFGHGTDNAYDEAAWLVLYTIGAPLDGSFKDWQRPVGSAQADAIQGLARRRIQEGQPLAYLIGKAWFAGLEFLVSPDVLVPRSPLAEVILERFSPWIDAARVNSVLDLCTGCACIAVAIAHYLPTVRVDAVDISTEALRLARENVKRHGLGDRVKLIRSDLFHSVAGVQYDLIVANPPYVPAESLGSLPVEYRSEPELGLASGRDGLDAPLRILAGAAARLEQGGLLLCEVGESQERLSRLLPGLPFLWLEFESGGSGVFLLTRYQLEQAGPEIKAVIEEREHVP
jgi:ribosomal protein L3 glutamine methyltransferase